MIASSSCTAPPLAAPELLAPAGNWECARAAVANGADAIYFGLPQFNARLRADNFTLEELPRLIEFLHEHRVKGYVTLNTLVFPAELKELEQFLVALQAAGVDAMIVQDLGVLQLAQQVAPDVEVHASTQMTITSPEGARFAARQGVTRVVLARETSLREMERLHGEGLPPTEVFVHGALCVAYSGQCLTSESLGQRSANRGECAQACRLPYELVVDGAVRDLGDQRYLLSPQDLAAVHEIPRLIELGVSSFKIEGRLKAPEYVAAVCQVYRKAIDAALGRTGEAITARDRYLLEMTFSRGLFSGWMHGVDHQQLVHGRYSNKRGPLVGTVTAVGKGWVEIKRTEVPLKLGDGLLFDDGGDQNRQQGGRLYEMAGNRLSFQYGKVDYDRIRVGHLVYKTDDPHLDAELKRSFSGELPRPVVPLEMSVSGRVGEPLELSACGVTVVSESVLQAALNRPLTTEVLREQLGRLGGTGYVLSKLEVCIEGAVMLPLKELNHLRRRLVEQLASAAVSSGSFSQPRRVGVRALEGLLKAAAVDGESGMVPMMTPRLRVLCRTEEQLDAVLEQGVEEVYLDYEDIRRYGPSVQRVRALGKVRVLLATPRIQKATEQGFFKLIAAAEPDGVLIRNLGAMQFFQGSPLELVGDFSLNVANPLTARILLDENLSRVTASYDLNAQQLVELLKGSVARRIEIVLHQHMPMFHMEHCVFAAFMSSGKDYLTCGRPCERHAVALRDRVGMEHPLLADVGCRNTIYHGRAQSGAAFFQEFSDAGARHFRVELLRESGEEASRIVSAYQSLLRHELDAGQLVRRLHVANQLGVTSGTLTVL